MENTLRGQPLIDLCVKLADSVANFYIWTEVSRDSTLSQS
jgi:hypothetical protein